MQGSSAFNSIFSTISQNSKIKLFFLVFMLCHSIRWVATIWELCQLGDDAENMTWPEWVGEGQTFLRLHYMESFFQKSQVSTLLTNLNAGLNVLIYFLKHKQFITSLCQPDSPYSEGPQISPRSPRLQSRFSFNTSQYSGSN